jgi:malic enzyme
MSFPLQVLIDNIKDFAPIIYTPTVGLVCQNYSGLFRRPRGMYFSAKDKGEMMSMIYNWPGQQVLYESWMSVANNTESSFCLSSLLEICRW